VVEKESVIKLPRTSVKKDLEKTGIRRRTASFIFLKKVAPNGEAFSFFR
jgi:hypothetical protein